MPVIGFLNGGSAQGFNARMSAAFLNGLGEAGYADGRNVAIEYRWAENQLDRLATLAADLVGRNVTVLAATGPGAVLAAKVRFDPNTEAKKTTPVMFSPGRLRLATRPSRTGSLPYVNTIGIVVVADARSRQRCHEKPEAARGWHRAMIAIATRAKRGSMTSSSSRKRASSVLRTRARAAIGGQGDRVR